MSKKERRLESKKKKAIALLNLIETKIQEKDMNEPKAKRACKSGDENIRICENPTSPAVASTGQKADHLQLSGSETAEEEYARARQVQRELQKSSSADSGRWEKAPSKYGPKIQLCLENMLPFSNLKDGSKGTLQDRLPPLFMADLQHLLLLASLKNFSHWTPRWCRLSRPRKLSSVILVVLQDVSVKDFQEHHDCFPFLKNSFLSCVEMVSPVQYNSFVERELSRVPLLISQLKCYTKREDIRCRILRLISKPPAHLAGQEHSREKLEAAHTDPKAGDLTTTTGTHLSPADETLRKRAACEDSFPRTSLLLSSAQLMEEGYPLPVGTKNDRYRDYVFSKDSYLPVTATSPLFAVDCEMCQTVARDFELTRVSVVNEDKEVVYDQLVKPYNQITNYLTMYSGMTAEKLASVTKRVEDVRKELKELLPADAILCGQSLWNDLNALKMFHPYVIDTSIIFNQSGDRKVRCGLRKLAYNFLGQKIQGSQQGHCSIEDAKATMDLVKLKLSKDIEFGDAMLGGVYFPNIKTYFEDPSKAQNVQEVFSAHPASTSTVCDPSLSAPSPSQPSSTHVQNSSRTSLSNARTDSDSDVSHRTNGCVQSMEPHSKEEDSEVCGAISGERTEDFVVEGTPRQKEMGSCGEEVRNQREVFFQQDGSTVALSFFELLADNHNTASVVGSKGLLSALPPHPKLRRLEVSSDAEACSLAARVSQDTEFTWVELRAFADALSGNSRCCKVTGTSEERKHLLAQLNSHMEELVGMLQTQSLVALVMTGRSEGTQHFNAATFLKMT